MRKPVLKIIFFCFVVLVFVGLNVVDFIVFFWFCGLFWVFYTI